MWIKKKIFEAEESPLYPGKYTITCNHDEFKLLHTEGSFNIICARLLNLSFAQYLRFCRDICGALIVGKNSIYPVPYFKPGEMLNQLVKLLNNRANLVLWEAEHPDWEEHQAEMFEREKARRENENVFNQRKTK